MKSTAQNCRESQRTWNEEEEKTKAEPKLHPQQLKEKRGGRGRTTSRLTSLIWGDEGKNLQLKN